jgi:hypothetical protein
MKKEKNSIWKTVCLSLLIFLFFQSCGMRTVAVEPQVLHEGVKNVLVLPFRDFAALYGTDNNVRCPVCGKVFLTGDVAEGAEVLLTKQLVSILKNRTDFKIIYPGEEGMLYETKGIAETGKSLGADTVITGHIYRFRKRAGTSYSVESPASVAFDLHFVKAGDGRVVMAEHMDETQRPLSENLFEIGSFIKRKGEWVDAEDLAVSGLEGMLQIFFKK